MSRQTDAVDRALTYCTYCPKLCRPACPVSNVDGREAVIPQAKMAILDELRREARPWKADYASVLYACTGCLRCQSYCAHSIDVEAALLSGREQAHERGIAPEALRGFADRWHRRSRSTLSHMRKKHADRIAPRAEVGVLPGCDADEISGWLFSALDHLGLRAKLADLPYYSTGHALLGAGDRSAFREVSRAMAAAAPRYQLLVTACPSCAESFRDHYPAAGLDSSVRLLHVTELLAPSASRFTPQRRLRRALYHDSCYLSRHLRVQAGPRALVGRCVEEMHEFNDSGDQAACSGGGGLLPLTDPATSRGIAEARLAEARERSIETVVTACPTSRRTLRNAAQGIEVIDILELLGKTGAISA